MKSILQNPSKLPDTDKQSTTDINLYGIYADEFSPLIEYTARGMDQYVCSTVIVNQTRVLL